MPRTFPHDSVAEAEAMSTCDDHMGAPTWSAMVSSWREREGLAVIAGTTTWSRTELLARAAGAAAHLQSLTDRDRPIPALFTSTAASFAYVIGGASSARPLAPLGPRLTERELAPCLAALGSDVLLSQAEFEPLASVLAARAGARVVVVDEPPADESGGLDLDLRPDATAFVLHTSGTTGRPKAVPYTQGRLAARVRVNAGLCSLDADAVYATASPFHHIAGFGNYAVALAAGAALVPLPRFTIEAWKELASLGVTHALTVPTMLELLLDAGVLALPTLRVLQYGASPIHPDTLRRTLEALPHVRLVNLYGQTEGSPITCLSGDDHGRIATEGRLDLLASVGRAAPGVEVWIDTADHRGIGEVLARASHFFLPDADGVLRTGDLGRLDGEGYLFLAGRRGDKIIRGGENVYPVEVEQVLEEHPAVREAAVVGVPDQRFGEVVKAVIVPADPAMPPETEELRAHARTRLAGFKVPTLWAFVAELPRNASGKLLRQQLTAGPPDPNQ
jgi:acyl-CoA synthetase (AMP-forming)/AMP-acid ligase II